MKKSKIIVPALGIIAFATAASITGTVAWFTANSRVTITGMQFKTTVSNNLFVSQDTTEANFGESITQTRKGILLPASTVDGVSYYYTTSAKADGSASAGFTLYNPSAAATGDDASSYADKFSQDYKLSTDRAGELIDGEEGGKAYLDYSFYLKANFVSDATAYLYMNKCNIVYDPSGTPAAISETAWRVALFVADATTGTPAACTEVTDANTAKLVNVDTDTNANLKTILAPAGAENQSVVSTKNQGVNGVAANAKADVQKENSAAIVFTSSTSQTKYFKCVVRLWLEGEDTTCTVDTFKSLTSDYKLDLGFETASTSTGAVAVLGSVA